MFRATFLSSPCHVATGIITAAFDNAKEEIENAPARPIVGELYNCTSAGSAHQRWFLIGVGGVNRRHEHLGTSSRPRQAGPAPTGAVGRHRADCSSRGDAVRNRGGGTFVGMRALTWVATQGSQAEGSSAAKPGGVRGEGIRSSAGNGRHQRDCRPWPCAGGDLLCVIRGRRGGGWHGVKIRLLIN